MAGAKADWMVGWMAAEMVGTMVFWKAAMKAGRSVVVKAEHSALSTAAGWDGSKADSTAGR